MNDEVNNVVKLRDEEAGLMIIDANVSGDERLCAWIKAAGGVASALGINITIEPTDDGRVSITAKAVRPLPTWKDLRGR